MTTEVFPSAMILIFAALRAPVLAEVLTVTVFEATATVAHDSLDTAATAPVVVTMIAFL